MYTRYTMPRGKADRLLDNGQVVAYWAGAETHKEGQLNFFFNFVLLGERWRWLPTGSSSSHLEAQQ